MHLHKINSTVNVQNPDTQNLESAQSLDAWEFDIGQFLDASLDHV